MQKKVDELNQKNIYVNNEIKAIQFKLDKI